MNAFIATLTAITCLVFFAGCKKEITAGNSNARLVFQFRFDSTQARLNNTGAAAPLVAGNGAQSPRFNKMSAHYIELTPTALTALGSGAVLYRAEETTAGGNNAINFEKAVQAGHNESFFSVPLQNVPKGTYEWLRVSLAYQNFDVRFYIDTTVNGITIKQEFGGTAAGFIGFNTYIKNFTIKNNSLAVNANKLQGFWGFETTVSAGGVTVPFTTTGQAPQGATTVVNPLFATSPIPQGSCVVTSNFGGGKLTITGNETKDIVVVVSLSTNKSFEWKEVVADGRWEPGKGEQVVDMGVRGMLAQIQ